MKKEDIREIKLEYVDKINIPKVPFGIEIEFAGASFEKVKTDIKKLFGYPIEEQDNKVNKYDKWKVVKEATVQKHISFTNIEGGEINTPILHNTKQYWEDLKRVCTLLKNEKNIRINLDCSVHIHTDKSIYTTLKELTNLVKLWIVYEPIIYRFGFGDIKTKRNMLDKFAKPYVGNENIKQLVEKINHVETIEELMQATRYDRKNGLNLVNIIRDDKTTIETRVYNPTLNEEIIQNYTRFNQNFLNYAKTENFDEEFINYKLDNYQEIYIDNQLKEDFNQAKELMELIIKNEIDRLKLLRQYLTFEDDEIEKTARLWYHQ